MVGRSEVVARLEGVEWMVKVRLAVHGLGRARGREVERHFALAGIGVARRGLEEICAAEVSRGGRGGGEDGGERRTRVAETAPRHVVDAIRNGKYLCDVP